jgi:GAF domain-containing protein
MKEPAFPADEEYRIEALRDLSLLDTPHEPDFDSITRLGQKLFAVPTCLVTLVDHDRQWFKARAGLGVSETPRAVSFCGHAILQPDVFVVPDALADERFFDNPLVTGDPYIRFYAGAPIRLPSGYTVGTVCLLDREPRSAFGEAQRSQLADLAALALSLISLRALREAMDQNGWAATRYHAALLAVAQPVAVLDGNRQIESSNAAFDALCGAPPWGVEFGAALGLADGSWERTVAEGQDAVIEARGARLVIRADPQGFIVLGEPSGSTSE